jgi:hypothetical protein
MNPVELKEHLGGEFLANKLRATVDGKLVILARLEGESYVLTDEGHQLAAKINVTKPAEEKPKAKVAARKTTKAVVESQEDSE